MVNWFRRSRRRVEAPTLRPRSDDLAADRRDLHEFTPPLAEFLGRAAYVQLMLFEALSRAVVAAPTTAAKAAIGQAADISIGKHRALAEEIARTGGAVAEAMEPYRAAADEFERRTRGADWYETVMTCYLAAGFLDDFFVRLAAGLPAGERDRIVAIYESESAEPFLAAELHSATDDNERLAARLAMWGRRLVGDTMLVARDALPLSDHHAGDEQRVEPVFTDLIATHTRRMDALGLTA